TRPTGIRMIRLSRINPKKPTRSTPSRRSRRLSFLWMSGCECKPDRAQPSREVLMKGFIAPLLLSAFAAATLAAGGVPSTPVAQGGTGTIKGHVKFTGKSTGNTNIRMGVDPKCAQANQGKQVFNEFVKAAAD